MSKEDLALRFYNTVLPLVKGDLEKKLEENYNDEDDKKIIKTFLDKYLVKSSGIPNKRSFVNNKASISSSKWGGDGKCKHLLQSGKNKGCYCNKNAKYNYEGDNYCKAHFDKRSGGKTTKKKNKNENVKKESDKSKTEKIAEESKIPEEHMHLLDEDE
jgi:hypothetical protein